MITEKEYLKAIETIKEYREQINNQAEAIIEIDNDKTKLIEKGKKIKLTRVHSNSTSKVGDVFEVIHSFYNSSFKKHPVIVFVNKNGYTSRISKETGWDYVVI